MKKTHYGSLNLTNIKRAVNIDGKVYDKGYGKEMKIEAVTFDDGNLGISVYDKESGQRIDLGKLIKSKY